MRKVIYRLFPWLTGISWKLSNGTLTIRGTGTSCLEKDGAPWYYSRHFIRKIVIESGVKGIGDWAFCDYGRVSSVTLHAGVTSIGKEAFKNCASLASIILPAGLTSIGDEAFQNCDSLTAISLPAGLTGIGDGVFAYCGSLASVSLPAGLTSIGEWTFFNCGSLTAVSLPAGVASIGHAAFLNCGSLTSVTNLRLAPQLISYSYTVIRPEKEFDEIVDDSSFLHVEKATLYVHAEAIEAYRKADGWKEFGTIMAIEKRN